MKKLLHNKFSAARKVQFLSISLDILGYLWIFVWIFHNFTWQKKFREWKLVPGRQWMKKKNVKQSNYLKFQTEENLLGKFRWKTVISINSINFVVYVQFRFIRKKKNKFECIECIPNRSRKTFRFFQDKDNVFRITMNGEKVCLSTDYVLSHHLLSGFC